MERITGRGKNAGVENGRKGRKKGIAKRKTGSTYTPVSSIPQV